MMLSGTCRYTDSIPPHYLNKLVGPVVKTSALESRDHGFEFRLSCLCQYFFFDWDLEKNPFQDRFRKKCHT